MKTRGGPLLLAALIAALALFAAAPPASAACECSGRDARDDLRGAFREADAAFIGTFQGRSDPLADDPEASPERVVVNYFAVAEVRKGELDDFLSVLSTAEGSECGLTLREGEETGLLVHREPAGLRATACDVADPAAMPGGPGSSFGLSGSALAAVIAGVLLLGVFAALAMGPGREALRGR